MKSMLCMLRKTASTIPFYRYHRFIGISCHTPAVSGVHSPSPIIKRPLCGRHFPLAHHQTPAVSGVHSPSPNQSRPPFRASILPRQINHARVASVSSPSPNPQRPLCVRPFPLAIIITSAVGRCPFPLAIYGEGGGDRPGVRSSHSLQIHHARRCKRLFTIASYQMPAVACVYSPSPYHGEGARGGGHTG